MAVLRGYSLRGLYADLPVGLPDTRFPSGWGGAANFTPTTGAELTTALASAKTASGMQIIELNPAITYTGSFTLPNKNDGYPIVIRPSTFASFQDRRVNTSDDSLFANIVSTSTNPWCITSEFNAHDIYMMGIKVSRSESGINPTNLIRLGLGNGSTNPTTPTQLPTRIFIDRCWIQGPNTINIKAGIRFDVNIGAVTRSRIANIKNTGADAQAILIINNGQGMPIWIHDNFLEGTGENIICGGDNPPMSTWPWNVWDVTFTRNHFFKPTSWCERSPDYAGTNYSVKNLFELKCGRRILVEGNILEHSWGPDQDGTAFVLKSSFDPSTANFSPEYGVQDVTIRHNIVRHVAAAFRLAGVQNTYHRANRFYIHNNLCYGLNTSKSTAWAAASIHQCEVIDRVFEFNMDHNTFYTPVTTNYTLYVQNNLTKFRVTNNLWSRSTYGVRTGGQSGGTASLNASVPDGSYTVNYNAYPNITLGEYPANNFAPNTVSGIGYVNATNDDDGDYHLSGGSPYKNAGSDGKDIGCDVDKVLWYTNGVDA